MRWLAHGEHDVPDTLDWLTRHERDHLDSIRFTKRRSEYLTRRWTTKRAVAGVLGLDPSQCALTRIEERHRPSGAPYVHLDGSPAGGDVSMTDRSGWAVCLVGEPETDPDRSAATSGSDVSGTVGVDLEVVEPRSDAFVADYFTAAERAHVASQQAERHDELANLIWSAKEAALKVLQVGLRVDTRAVEVRLSDERRADGWAPLSVVGVDGGAAVEMPGWWRRAGVFLLTIAFAEPAEPPLLLPAGGDLDTASPQHSWVDSPVW